MVGESGIWEPFVRKQSAYGTPRICRDGIKDTQETIIISPRETVVVHMFVVVRGEIAIWVG